MQDCVWMGSLPEGARVEQLVALDLSDQELACVDVSAAKVMPLPELGGIHIKLCGVSKMAAGGASVSRMRCEHRRQQAAQWARLASVVAVARRVRRALGSGMPS